MELDKGCWYKWAPKDGEIIEIWGTPLQNLYMYVQAYGEREGSYDIGVSRRLVDNNFFAEFNISFTDTAKFNKIPISLENK